MAGKERPDVLCPSALTAHAWSAARDAVAVVPNGKEVVVYAAAGEDCRQWAPLHTLAVHDQKVLDVDWDPTTNRILTCSEDRTAFVWEFVAGRWEPKVVHLGSAVNRAVLCGRWCPGGQKFAVGTGSRLVCVCYFEAEQNWWVGQVVKHHTSSVVALAWNPQHSGLLATCSTDHQVRFIAASLKGIDEGESLGKFGALLAAVPARAWVTACHWTPDGARLAFLCHDCTLGIVDITAGYSVQTVKTGLLPLTSVVAPSNDILIAACADCFLYCISRVGQAWAVTGKFKNTARSAKQGSSISQAMARFQLEASTGQTLAVDKLESRHQNVVSDLRLVEPGGQWKVSSSGYDGQVFLWTASDVAPL